MFTFWSKADRYAAWILLIVILLYVLTGYGMTKGIIDRGLATSLHLNWLGAIGLVAFVIHTFWAIRLSFCRWKIWNVLTKIILIIFYLLLILFFLYLQFFYKKTASVQTQSQEKIFTSETLSVYNGLNGQPAYISVDGLVYDVSSLFKNGEHRGCRAGQDVSGEFYQDHTAKILEGFTVVGKYQAD